MAAAQSARSIALAADLKTYPKSTGTVRFPFADSPSASLVARLVNARIAELQRSRMRSKSEVQRNSEPLLVDGPSSIKPCEQRHRETRRRS